MECGCNREEANVNNDDIKVTALFTAICSLTTDQWSVVSEQHLQITLTLVDNLPEDEEYDRHLPPKLGNFCIIMSELVVYLIFCPNHFIFG